MASYLITGASRGLGLEFVKQLATLSVSKVGKIFATVRSGSDALEETAKAYPGRIFIIKLDLQDETSILDAVQEVDVKLDGEGLDVLINNAGILQWCAGGTLAMDNLSESWATNVLGTHLTTRAFVPLLRRGTLKKIVNISTTLGSMALAPNYSWGPAPAYKISKAALNMLTVQYALDLKDEGFTVVSLSPGWLRTELGGENADLSVEEGASASLQKIIGADKEINGQFLSIEIEGGQRGRHVYDGTNPPW